MPTDILKAQLRRTGRLTHSRWAAWLQRQGPTWQTVTTWGLSIRQKKALQQLLERPRWAEWLQGAFSQGRGRQRAIPAAARAALGSKVHAFPVARQGLLLIGHDNLQPDQREIWRIVALGLVQPSPASSPDLFALLSHRLHRASHTPQAITTAIVETTAEVFAAQRTYLGIPEGRVWRILAFYGETVPNMRRWTHIVSPSPLTDLRQGAPLILTAEPWPGLPSPPDWSWLVLPITYRQRLIGFLSIARPGTWEAADIETLRSFTARIGWAIESALAFDEMSDHLRRKAVMSEILFSGLSNEDIEDIATHIARYLARVFKADASAVCLRRPHQQAQCLGAYPEAKTTAQTIKGTICERMLKLQDVARFSPTSDLPCALAPESRAGICVPLRSPNAIIGALCLTTHREEGFSEEEERLAMLAAGQLALLLETARLREETAKRTRRLEMVHHIIQSVLGAVDIQQIVEQAAQRLAQYFGAQTSVVSIVLTGPRFQPGLLVRGVAGSCDRGPIEQEPTCPPEGIVAEVLRSGKSILLPDVTQASNYHPYPGFTSGSELCVPIVAHEDDKEVIGAINIEHAEKFALEEDDLLAVEAVAGMLSTVLANAQRHQQLRATVQHLQAVRETALDIVSAVQMEPLLQRVMQRIKKMIDTRGVEIGLVDQETQTLRIVASESAWGSYQGMALPLGKGAGGWVAATGQTLALTNFNTWEHKGDMAAPALFRAVVSVPLKHHDEVLGALTIFDDREGHVFSPQDVQLLELLAPQIAIALRNARLYEELHRRIIAQEKAEREMVQSARLAAVGEMAAAIAQELNGPLTTTMGFVELALDQVSSDQQLHSDLTLVLQESRRARDIIQRLLDFARYTEPLRMVTNINDLIHDTLALVHHLLKTAGITLEADLQDNLPLVSVDRAEIKQVLLTLIHHAIRAMPHGGTLTIATTTRTDERRWVVVTVANDGKPPSPEQLAHIFDPIHTPHNGVHSGLPVSHSIIRNHNGHITVTLREGGGTLFTISLPAV